MIYEYAIDPEIAADSKNLQILENYFGFDKARVIVRYPYNWELVVLTKACDISGDINRAKVEEQLRRLNGKKAYKSIKNTYNVAREWLSNSLDVTPPFHCIVSNEEEDDVVNISDVNPSHFKFNTPTKWERQNKTLDNIKSIFLWILQNSKDIYIVDPYFSPFAPEYQRSFRWILETLKSRSDWEEVQLHICFSCKRKKPPFIMGEEKEAYKKTMENISNVFPNINFVIKDTDMHPRYIFSDDVCYNSDNSFDVKPSALFSVYLNSWETVNDLKKIYFDEE